MVNKLRSPLSVTIAICAYNEERNIGKLIQTLQTQRTQIARINEILVVASGCTDRTSDIVASLAKDDPRIELIVEDARTGKVTAINEALSRATGDVFILESADTIPGPDAVELLTRPFQSSQVGAVTARPVPVNDPTSLVGAMAHVLWDLHHRVSLQVPKPGEMIAFRPLFSALPSDVGNDEDWIGHQVEASDLRMTYVPEAVVYNRGPSTLGEFLKQRIRVNAQEIYHWQKLGVAVPSWDGRVVILALWRSIRKAERVRAHVALVVVEAVARVIAWSWVTLFRRSIPVWEELPSTKVVEFRQ